MLFYILLKYKIINRSIKEIGVHPLIGYTIVAALFILSSVLIFCIPKYAQYYYLFIGLTTIFSLSEYKRNIFLQTIYTGANYYKIRIIENIVISSPFLLFLNFKQSYIAIYILFIASIIFAFYRSKIELTFTIPTPFGKNPFEFCVGFRKSILLILFLYMIVSIALYVDNFNLGFVSLIVLLISFLFYYLTKENDYYILIFNLSPSQFLLKKIEQAIIQSTILSLPIMLILGVSYPSYTIYLLASLILGYIYLTTYVLAKYAYLENSFNLIFTTIMIVIFTPIVAAPIFFLKAKNEIYKTKQML